MLSLAVQFSVPSSAQSVALIRQAVDNRRRIIRPEANAANDVSPVADNFALRHMLLQLKRSSAQHRQLEQLAAEVSDPSSQNYRQFLTAVAADYRDLLCFDYRAGFQTVVNQHAGSRQGLPTPAYHLLFKHHGLAESPNCYAPRGNS